MRITDSRPTSFSRSHAREYSIVHGCVLSDTHALYCWGLNAQGQVGNGIPNAQVLAPERIDIACSNGKIKHPS